MTTIIRYLTIYQADFMAPDDVGVAVDLKGARDPYDQSSCLYKPSD